jgi:acetate kinase
MKNILVANAGSPSVKFQVFTVDGVGKLPRAVATTLE